MIDEQNAEFIPDMPEMTPEEIAIVSPQEDEPLVLEDPVSDASGDGGSGPAGDKPAEPTDDPAVEVAADPEKPGQTVPLATHIEDRKAYQAKIEEITSAHEAKMQALIERLSPVQPAAEAENAAPMPDPVLDPDGFGQWLNDREAKNLEAVEAQRAEMVEAQSFHTAQQQEAAFKALTPGYEVAFDHLRNGLAQELRLTRHDMTDAAIVDAVNASVVDIAKNAVKAGGNAAETLYRLAQARGFTEPAADPEPAPEPAPEPSAVAQINRASAASKSIGGAPGAATTRLTASAIANMSEAELAALPDSVFEQAMG